MDLLLPLRIWSEKRASSKRGFEIEHAEQLHAVLGDSVLVARR